MYPYSVDANFVLTPSKTILLSLEESKADKIVFLKEEIFEIKWSEGITNIILFLSIR